MLIHLIRHAHAGSRSKWDGDDSQRPLSDRGRGQAAAIAAALTDRGIDALWSSPSLRCRQTLEPLADKTGLAVEVRAELDEGSSGGPALDALLAAAAAGQTVAACSHGDVLPDVVAFAVRRGAELVGGRALHKAGRCECTVVDGQIARIVVFGPPDGET